MIYVTLREGDAVTIDNVHMIVESVLPSPEGYWFKIPGPDNYFNLRFFLKTEVSNKFLDGTLILGNTQKELGGLPQHSHHWCRYSGLNRIYDYCDCGAKRDVNWRDLK